MEIISNKEYSLSDLYEKWGKKKSDFSNFNDDEKIYIINSVGFNVVKENNIYKVKDSYNEGLGGVENDTFTSLNGILNRLSNYIYDVISE